MNPIFRALFLSLATAVSHVQAAVDLAQDFVHAPAEIAPQLSVEEVAPPGSSNQAKRTAAAKHPEIAAIDFPGIHHDPRTMVSAVAVLTIHVSDTNVHQSVFEFLKDILKLPVEYGPTYVGQRRYAAVYAGNMFIEPCGPYSDMQYPVKDFKALFFGLNCRSEASSASIAKDLQRLNISSDQPDADTFRVQDEVLSGGIYLAICTKAKSKSDLDQEAAFQKAMDARQQAGPGLEYVKEICLGYTSPADLRLWNEILGSSAKTDESCWTLNDHQRLRLVKSDVRGVVGIVWKVRSLEAAERYLKDAQCFGRIVDGRIELDKKQTCGLLMQLSAD